MNFSKPTPARSALGALSAPVLLASFVGLAYALQIENAPDNTFTQLPAATDSTAPGSQLFTLPNLPGAPGSTPGRPGVAPNGQPLPGQPLPGQPMPGAAPGQVAPGQLPPAPIPAQMQGNPKLAALFQKAVDAQRKGDLDAAAVSYREVLRAQPDALPAHMNLALVLLQQKKTDRAVWHLKRAVALEPRSPQARAILAQTYLQLKQPREAYEQWKQLAAMKLPDNGQAALTAGALAFEELKNPAEAERWLRQASTQSKGGDPGVAMLLSKVLSARGKHAEAKSVLAPVAKKFPKVVQIQTALADTQWQSGEKSAAITTLRALEKNIPAADRLSLGQVRMMLGRALLQDKQYAQASEMLKKAMASLPEKSPALQPAQAMLAQTLAEKARADEKNGNLSAALVAWNEAAALFPDNPTAYIQRGRLLHKQGKDDEALAQYNRALKMLPREPSVIVAAAQLEEKTGDAARALAHWRTLIETRPEYSPAYFNLARLAARQKQLASQMDYLETRLQKNPNQRAPYDAILEVGHDSGRGELARDWVEQMAKKYPKAQAPRNALLAFNKRHPAKADPKPEATPTPKPQPTSTPTPKPVSTPEPAKAPDKKPDEETRPEAEAIPEPKPEPKDEAKAKPTASDEAEPEKEDVAVSKLP